MAYRPWSRGVDQGYLWAAEVHISVRGQGNHNMQPNLARYLNKTVLVSIPALFDDALCRPYKLLGAEITGLWLQSEELTNRLLTSESGDMANLEPAVFVPFSQMAGVLVAT